MKFCILGSKAGGSPQLGRNPSATALLLPDEVWLFDCGEGTQLRLMEVRISRSSIRRIFISHLHCDHVLGLFGLLSSLCSDKREKPLALYIPKGGKEFIENGLKAMDISLLLPFEIVEMEDEAGELFRTDYFSVSMRLLEHRIPSYGFRVEELPRRHLDIEKAQAIGLTDGKLLGIIRREGEVELSGGKTVRLEEIQGEPSTPRIFVYCGDTRPCQAAVALAHNADVLIYESTFDHSFREKAADRFHSTSEEAADIARKANVKKLYMTHFSSRYHDVSPLLAEARKIFPKSYLAWELNMENI